MDHYLFIHIPKTAGTSFRLMLYKQFCEEDIFPNETFLKKNSGEYPDLNTVSLKYREVINSKLLVAGHLPYFAKTLFVEEPKVFSFFRDPVSRVISFLHHCRIFREELANYSLEEIFEKNIKESSNLQVKYFSRGYLNNGIPQLKVAVDNLHKLDCIGITEDFKNSVRLLENEFGWNLGKIIRCNGTKIKLPVSKRLTERVQEANQMDIQFYQIAKGIFERKLKEMGLQNCDPVL